MSGQTFAIMLSVIQSVRDEWDDQSEQLRGGHKRLTDASNAVDDLGDRVGPVARTYLTTWLTEVQNHADAAQGRADGLAGFTTSVVQLDGAAADDLRAILPWDERYNAVRPTIDGVPDFPTDDPGPAPDPTQGPIP
ncbi:hypothetical protein ACHAAC_09635 [Aeromicrobium sp. CF4.19]|uniref:hypothetical protein n=1 Tax=Aeromicrobium sp. CF4.19 TaxID=3373082 RepID=UPI003EE5777D